MSPIPFFNGAAPKRGECLSAATIHHRQKKSTKNNMEKKLKKPKPGRPKKRPEDRAKWITVNLRVSTRDMIHEAAQEVGESLDEYIRAAVTFRREMQS